MNLPEPPRPDLTGPPPPPPSMPRKDHSARNWTIAVVVIVGLIILGALNKNSSSSDGDTGDETESGIDPGFGSQDASGDVTLESCSDGGQYAHNVVECKITIHNTSDGTSDYYI